MERAILRKALDGFIIPPRTFFQMFVSAVQGTYALLEESTRKEYIHKLDTGVINEAVLSQSPTGSLIIMSLFHDLQNPLFQRHQFDPLEFLSGVGPALERYHNVSGALANQLNQMQQETKKKLLKEAEEKIKEEEIVVKIESSHDKENVDANNNNNNNKKENDSQTENINEEARIKDELLAILPSFLVGDKSIDSVLDYEWKEDAMKNPESLAGQLSNMLTDEFFQIQQLSAKTSFLMQHGERKVSFKEDSCTVNSVALLSARSFLCVERPQTEDLDIWGTRPGTKYEMIDYPMEESEIKKRKGGVAAQIEVLYDVTQEYITEEPERGAETAVDNFVAVAVMEGWLNGGPENELRWKLALHRPAVEFPGN